MRMLVVGLLLLSSCRETNKESGLDETNAPNDTQAESVDADGDGFGTLEDCDDSDASIHPGARETCDDIDNDCDGLFDDEDPDVSGTTTWFIDSDVDDYGSSQLTLEACLQPQGYVDNARDCNDLNASVHPDAEEVCDEIDNDCDGFTDENDATDVYTWYYDEDGDGYGVDSDTATACDAPRDYAAHDGDCDDADPAYHPGALESDCADQNDYNCDGSVGFADADSDGFAACEDCDDSDANANDDAVETCDGVDNDCDGLVDSDDPDTTGTSTWYADADGDGHGGQQFELEACEAAPGYVATNDDCDDLDPSAYPGGAEVCDDADNDCDGDVDEGVGTVWYADSDGDGYGDATSPAEACDSPAGYVGNGNDCDDSSASTSPASFEICDSLDNDCDGSVDEDAINAASFYVDADADGYGSASSSTTACDAPTGYTDNDSDCNDADPAVSPVATEICDGADNDCDGGTDEADAADASTFYADTDNDGFGDANTTTLACTAPSGYVADATDCNDSDTTSTTLATDADCDTVLTADDCDDADSTSTTVAIDADCDTVLTAEDCNDSDANSTTLATDADCDGAVTADDCDDLDNTVLAVSGDGDCDGVLTADDCNDADPTSTTVALDADCDTVLTADDCDDLDSTVLAIANDADCDGTVTADDCDDGSSTSTTVATDADCDTVLTADDCDDTDNTLLAVANDVDCDGALTADDCDDSNSSLTHFDGSSQSCPDQSCVEILNNGYSTGDGSYWIDPDGSGGSGAFEVYCDMTTDSGGWTLVLMTKASDQATFRYDSQYWTTTTLLNETTTDPSSDTNMKNLAYNTLPFTEIRLDMTSLGNSHTITTTQTSAHAIFTGSHHDPGLSRTEYLDWIDESNSNWDNQANCNNKGFQVGVGQQWSCRYGINMNNEGNCGSNDAAVGFGCHTQNYGVSVRIISCGGFRWSPDTRYGRKGWIFVR